MQNLPQVTAFQEWDLKPVIISSAVEVGYSFNYFSKLSEILLIQVLYTKSLNQDIVRLCAERFVPVLSSRIKNLDKKCKKSKKCQIHLLPFLG